SAGGPVSVDNSLMMLSELEANPNKITAKDNPYFEPRPMFVTRGGRFDHNKYKLGTADLYLVSRISNVDQIDQAIYAERFLFPLEGYYHGFVYVDSEFGQGGGGDVYTDEYLVSQPKARSGNFGTSEGEADMNIALAEHYVRESGFPLK